MTTVYAKLRLNWIDEAVDAVVLMKSQEIVDAVSIATTKDKFDINVEIAKFSNCKTILLRVNN